MHPQTEFNSGALLSFQGVSRNFGDTQALIEISFGLAKGQVVGLIGHNGAGKTSLLRCAVGLLCPSKGSVLLGEFNLGENPSFSTGAVGYLGAGDRTFPPRLTPLESLAMFGVLQGLSPKRSKERTRELAAELHASDCLEKPYQALSSGQRQRIGLIRTLLHSPEVLLLDEPTFALDSSSSRDVFGLIRREADRGKLVVISSHDLDGIESVCDRFLVLHKGRLVASGDHKQVLPLLEAPSWRLRFRRESSREGALELLPNLVRGDAATTAFLHGNASESQSVELNLEGLVSIESYGQPSLSALLAALDKREDQGGELRVESSPKQAPISDRRARNWFRAFLAITDRDMRTEFSYRFKILVQFVVLLLWAVMFYYMAQVYRQDEDMGAALFHNPLGFLLIGLGALEVSNVVTARMGKALREEQLLGTLEPYFATGRNPLILVVGSLVWPLCTALVLASALYVVVLAVMGGQVQPNWLGGAVAAILGCLALGAFGLASAAFVHRFKRGDPVALVVNMLGLLTAGAYFPREIMPQFVQSATAWIPHTTTLQAVRSALLGGSGFASPEFRDPIQSLLIFNLIAVPTAVGIWSLAHKRARSRGSIADA